MQSAFSKKKLVGSFKIVLYVYKLIEKLISSWNYKTCSNKISLRFNNYKIPAQYLRLYNRHKAF